MAQLAPDEDIRGILDRMASEAQEAAFAIQVSPTDPADLKALTDLGVLVMPLSQETNLLQATFLNVSDEFGDDQLAPFVKQPRGLSILNEVNVAPAVTRGRCVILPDTVAR